MKEYLASCSVSGKFTGYEVYGQFFWKQFEKWPALDYIKRYLGQVGLTVGWGLCMSTKTSLLRIAKNTNGTKENKYKTYQMLQC